MSRYAEKRDQACDDAVYSLDQAKLALAGNAYGEAASHARTAFRCFELADDYQRLDVQLSAAQRRAMDAAVSGKLVWVRSPMGGDRFYILAEKGRRVAVRQDTAYALGKRGLLVLPRAQTGDWSSVPVEPTDKGRVIVSTQRAAA